MPGASARVVYRIMLAAVETVTETDREACILGAIQRSLLDEHGPHHLDVPYVLRETFKLHEWGRYVTGDLVRFPVTPVDVFDIAPIQARFRTCHKETRSI